MANLIISETFVNKTENYIFGESEPYETFMSNKGELFRYLMREYGRCTSKMYLETSSGDKPIGWVFEKRARYEDSKETYLQETWVTLHTQMPEKTVKYFYGEVLPR